MSLVAPDHYYVDKSASTENCFIVVGPGVNPADTLFHFQERWEARRIASTLNYAYDLGQMHFKQQLRQLLEVKKS